MACFGSAWQLAGVALFLLNAMSLSSYCISFQVTSSDMVTWAFAETNETLNRSFVPNAGLEEAHLERKLRSTPYYLKMRAGILSEKKHWRKAYNELESSSQVKDVPHDQRLWVLPDKNDHPTRNHDMIVLEYGERQLLLSFLGRWNRWVSVLDMYTGETWSREAPSSVDPLGVPFNDLNHVYSVLVDSLDGTRKEIWLICGFGGDVVDKEQSIKHARIIDLETLEVRLGPELPYQAGACVASALEIIPGEPPVICSFGGTEGSHDSGIFHKSATCYDRKREKFWYPFGRLPFGFDHGNLAVVPAGACQDSDPQRILILSFRTKAYGTPLAKVLAFDMPKGGFRLHDLKQKNLEMEKKGEWYMYDRSVFTGSSMIRKDNVLAPRDAAGLVLANNGKTILQFGGVHHANSGKVTLAYRQIRGYDVCNMEWSLQGALSIKSFALQAAASEKLQVAFVCGGTAGTWTAYHNELSGGYANQPWCMASRLGGNISLMNRHGAAAKVGFPKGFLPGQKFRTTPSM